MLETFDPVLLARIQFAFTVSFHIVFPALSIGLGSYLAVLEALWLFTGEERYLRLFRIWVKAFALAFGMGVVSGIVLSYQFGTNWSVFSDKVGPVIGPLMGYEVLTAFFLEAGFLGIMLFGVNRVPRSLHFFATLAVAVGALVSAFWILSANSWMHTPAGHGMNAAGQFVPRDWLAIIFNPSFPYRLVHMVLAAYLATAFLVGATGAYHLLRGRRGPDVRTMFSMAMWMAALVAPVQLIVGDVHGLNTLEHQPAKVAAMEGHFEAEMTGAPLILFGLPDSEAGETRHALQVPKLGSLILTHDLNGTVRGLKSWPREDWPRVSIVFWSFRVMVGIGLLMIATGLVSLWLRRRRKLHDTPLFSGWCVLMGPSGFVALLAGWFVTEVGRQPYTVYGLLRTEDSVSPVAAAGVAGSLAAFVAVYLVVFGAGVWYLLRLVLADPEAAKARPLEGPVRAAGITPELQRKQPAG
ncbi:MAG: cytochrome ubiquinol oxidase subunit I [Propylenella sp.]